MSIDIKEALIMFSQLSEWAYKQQAITADQADENVKRLDELDRLARLGAAVESECEKYGPQEKIKCSIAIMNLVFPPEHLGPLERDARIKKAAEESLKRHDGTFRKLRELGD